MRRLDRPLSVAELALAIGASIDGQAQVQQHELYALATLGSAGPQDASFLSDGRYQQAASTTRAAAVIVRAAQRAALPEGCIALVCEEPYRAFATAAQLFEQRLHDQDRSGAPAGRIDPGAHVATGAQLAPTVTVAPGAVIEAGASLDDGAYVGPGAVIGARASVGARTRILANAVVYHDIVIGSDCVIHANSVVGSDGFGYARHGEGWARIPQLGSVIIGDRVEIGSNTSIDRGALDDTRIDSDCIIDNLVQIAHNVHIGAGSALAGCAGVAGSARIGRRCLIGGGAGVLGHLELADDVVVSPMSLVTRSLREAGFYSGSFPLMKNQQWERAAAVLRQLPDLRARLRHLEKLVKEVQ